MLGLCIKNVVFCCCFFFRPFVASYSIHTLSQIVCCFFPFVQMSYSIQHMCTQRGSFAISHIGQFMHLLVAFLKNKLQSSNRCVYIYQLQHTNEQKKSIHLIPFFIKLLCSIYIILVYSFNFI